MNANSLAQKILDEMSTEQIEYRLIKYKEQEKDVHNAIVKLSDEREKRLASDKEYKTLISGDLKQMYSSDEIYEMIQKMRKDLRLQLNTEHVDGTARCIIKAQIVALGNVLDKLGIKEPEREGSDQAEDIPDEI